MYLPGIHSISARHLSRAKLRDADVGGILSEVDLSRADLNGAILNEASITTKKIEEVRNSTPEQLTKIKPSMPVATLEAKAVHISTKAEKKGRTQKERKNNAGRKAKSGIVGQPRQLSLDGRTSKTPDAMKVNKREM